MRRNMETVLIEATKCSPYVLLDPIHNSIKIKGTSFPENVTKFYSPVFTWIEDYLEQLEEDKCVITFEIYYFNSSSSKIFLDILDMFDFAVQNGKNIEVFWIYEEDDDDSLEFGNEFKEDLNYLPFHCIPKSE